MTDMPDGNREADYEVGYGRPPKEHKFRKGQSGNPKGRPKKVPPPPPDDLRELAKAKMNEVMEVRGKDGSIRRMPKIEVAIELEINRVIEGKRSFKSLVDMIKGLQVLRPLAEVPPADDPDPTAWLRDKIDDMRRSMGRPTGKDEEDDSELESPRPRKKEPTA